MSWRRAPWRAVAIVAVASALLVKEALSSPPNLRAMHFYFAASFIPAWILAAIVAEFGARWIQARKKAQPPSLDQGERVARSRLPIEPTRESQQSSFWLWVAVTGVGWFLSVWFASSWLFFIGFLGMATGQWLVLRRWHVEKSGWWVPATLVSIVVGIAAGGITGGWLQDSLDGVVEPGFGIRSPGAPGRHIGTYLAATAFAGALMGSAMATAQWRILRRQAAHEWCWLAVHIGTVSLAAVGGEFLWLYGGRSVGSIVVHGLVVGLVVGVGTGGVLMHCLSAGRRGAGVAGSLRAVPLVALLLLLPIGCSTAGPTPPTRVQMSAEEAHELEKLADQIVARLLSRPAETPPTH
jgi:hypothetical protein